MGVSTDAILCYGVKLPDEFVDEFDDDESVNQENALAHMAYMGDEVDGVTLVYHCSNEFTEHIAAIPETVKRAARGYPQAIRGHLAVDPGWERTLLAFCEKMGIPWERPQWWLCSYWG